jgi:ribonuclease Z
MKPLFHPELVNGEWGDPVLYIEFLFERRSLLFDLGDLHLLAPRKLLRVSHVFVSHTHMDHFMGFDQLLRVCLGRERKLCLYGPPGFIHQVHSKLAGYTWNLVQNYAANFTIEAAEFHQNQTLKRAQFSCHTRFAKQELPGAQLQNGILLDEDAFIIRAAQALGLPTGKWLRELKVAILSGVDDTTPFRAWWRGHDGIEERQFTIGELKHSILRLVPGQKIAYVTDLIYNPANQQQVINLAKDADWLFIESAFLQEDADHAAETYHLTAHQAGALAKAALVKNFRTFHYSPRYGDNAEAFYQEAWRAFQ